MLQLYSTQLNWVEQNAWVCVYPYIHYKTDFIVSPLVIPNLVEQFMEIRLPEIMKWKVETTEDGKYS